MDGETVSVLGTALSRHYQKVRGDAEHTDVRARGHIILLEGIYLLKRRFQRLYDLSFWIDCSFERALGRAVFRAQEGLSQDATTEAYRTIYFPAQELHFARDDPRSAASGILDND
jgi:uridine kinase